MAFFPFERYTLSTNFTQDVLLERLLLNVQARQSFSLFRSRQGSLEYEGSVLPHEFNIKRIISYRNSFLPQIKGEISPQSVGCKIDITMRLHPAVLIFMCIWLGGVLFDFLEIAGNDVKDGKFEPASLIVLLMFAFGYTLATGGFKYESNKSKKFLQELFEATQD